MTRIPLNINVSVDPNVDFEPGMFSIPELEFFQEHLGESPVAAFYNFDDEGAQAGVIRARAEPFLTLLYEMEELKKARGIEWAGYEAIKDSITRFLIWHHRSKEIARRGGPRNPSMFHWDEEGNPHKYAIGTDSCELVRTEILDDGTRQPFRVRLALNAADALRESLADVAPWIRKKGDATASPVKDKLMETDTTIQCPICHYTENFAKGSRQKRSIARARMGRHLKMAREDASRHRMLYQKEYKS